MGEMPDVIPNYGDVLRMTTENITAMTEAFNREDYRTAHNIADAIGRLYAPQSNYYADRISHLVSQVFSTAYWGGTQNQVQKDFAQRERSFTPPF